MWGHNLLLSNMGHKNIVNILLDIYDPLIARKMVASLYLTQQNFEIIFQFESLSK